MREGTPGLVRKALFPGSPWERDCPARLRTRLDVGVLDPDDLFGPVRIARVRPDGQELELSLVPKR